MSDFENLLRARLEKAAPSAAANPPAFAMPSVGLLAIAAAASEGAGFPRFNARGGSHAYASQSRFVRTAPKSELEAPSLTFRSITDEEAIAAWKIFRSHGELIGETTTLAQLRQAWRRLAKRLHPDRAPELGSAPFLSVLEAFRLLRRNFR